VDRELAGVFDKNRIHAFLMSPAVWEGSECGVRSSVCDIRHEEVVAHRPSSFVPRLSSPALTRYDIIKLVAPYLDGKVVVSNLGWPSKELFAIKHQSSNFYMLGSMGMATPIGLGIALASSKQVVVIDGDGSLLMNPGTLARNTAKISTEEQLIAAMKEQGPGPAFIHVLAKPGNKDVPNIPIHHLEIKKQVMEFLKR
jgi:sulfopyruvate decarboxylase subunit beta